MLSHGNLSSNAHAAFDPIPDLIRPGDPVLSILPYAHIYESINVFGYLIRGAQIYVNRRIETLLDDLRSVRPVIVFCVPRIFERTFAGIVAKARAAGRPQGQARAVGAYRSGGTTSAPNSTRTARGPALRLQYALAQKLVLSKLRPQLGCDRLRVFVSGSAALHLDIALTFEAAGMPIMEGYGLTECSPVVTANRPGASRLGTVGRAIPGVDVRIAEDGEILVRGPNVMQGYFHNPDATAARIRDGWLATGDVGTLDADGYLRDHRPQKRDLQNERRQIHLARPRRGRRSCVPRSSRRSTVFGNGMPHPAALDLAELGGGLQSHGDSARHAGRGTRRARRRAAIRRRGMRPQNRRPGDVRTDSLGRRLGRAISRSKPANSRRPSKLKRRRVVEERYGALIVEFADTIVRREVFGITRCARELLRKILLSDITCATLAGGCPHGPVGSTTRASVWREDYRNDGSS